MGWTIGAVQIATEEGLTHIPGWLGDEFGIDWRPHGDGGDPAYVITHLRTGWSIFALTANLEDVQAAAERERRLREALEKIERAPAWGYPDRWETTPAEVRQLARAALGKSS